MREYELIYVIQPDATSEHEAEIHDRMDQIVESAEGVPLVRDDWGKRKLAYEIKKFQKGHYFQLNFLGDGTFIPELERVLRLEPDVLRFMSVLVDPRVADVQARIDKAREEQADRERKREERERLEAERAAASERARLEREAADAERAALERPPSDEGPGNGDARGDAAGEAQAQADPEPKTSEPPPES